MGEQCEQDLDGSAVRPWRWADYYGTSDPGTGRRCPVRSAAVTNRGTWPHYRDSGLAAFSQRSVADKYRRYRCGGVLQVKAAVVKATLTDIDRKCVGLSSRHPIAPAIGSKRPIDIAQNLSMRILGSSHVEIDEMPTD